MAQLSLVRSLSYLQEEQKHSQEFIEIAGIRLLRGSLSEITGEAGSGRVALTLAMFARLSREGEICAVVDVSNSFNPESAVLSGVVTENLLWIKCGGDVEKAFTAVDYLVQAKGFGVIWLNLNFVTLQQMRYIPSSFWYRFRVGVSGSQTLLLVTSSESILGSASSQSYSLKRENALWSGIGRFKLLTEMQINLHSRKPLSFRPNITKIRSIFEDA